MLRETPRRKILYWCAASAFLVFMQASYATAQDVDVPTELLIKNDTVDHFFGLENAVRLEGEIANFTSNETFLLNIGTQEIRIDYGFLNLDEEGLRFLRNADRVTVYGDINDDFFVERTLKARVIYIREGNRSILFD